MKAGNLKINHTSKWACCTILTAALCWNSHITAFINKQSRLLFCGVSAPVCLRVTPVTGEPEDIPATSGVTPSLPWLDVLFSHMFAL